MKFYTNNFIEYIYKLITGLNFKSKSFTTYLVTPYIALNCRLESAQIWPVCNNHEPYLPLLSSRRITMTCKNLVGTSLFTDTSTMT